MNTRSFGDYDVSGLGEWRRQADASREKVAYDTGVGELRVGQALPFDASLEHASLFLEDTEYIVVLVPKRTR